MFPAVRQCKAPGTLNAGLVGFQVRRHRSAGWKIFNQRITSEDSCSHRCVMVLRMQESPTSQADLHFSALA